MDLKEARYILAISRNKSISKAAETLFISQPSLSKYLKNLEQQLGTRLFDRVGSGYYPTYIGERYIHYAEKIVEYGLEWNIEFDDIMHHNHGR
ncbi:MAG: LysR family transcriptional regulator, partial [Paenibacillaceae bacterium]|nr:LysR family transcriptional regulator [Paenibacillaceae bacterium]